MPYTIGVVAHVDRLTRASTLADEVDASYVSFDDGTLGCTGNHLKVWRHLAESGLSVGNWAVVLEDDAVPVEGFRDQLDALLAAAPGPVVSLYLGTGYPIHWQSRVKRAVEAADSWIVSDGHLLHAVAVAIKAEMVSDMLKHVENDARPRRPIDEKITDWARTNHHFVVYSQPSICDHADEDSTIGIHPDGRPRNRPRKAWTVGTRQHWRSRPVLL